MAIRGQGWLEADDPAAMLDNLSWRSSSRKFRLFSLACCRALWRYLDDERGRPAVDAAELAADGGPNAFSDAAVREFWSTWGWGLNPLEPDDVLRQIAERCGCHEEVVWSANKAVVLAMDVRKHVEAKSTALRADHILTAEALSPRSNDYLLYQMGKDIEFEEEELAVAEEASAKVKASQVLLIHDIFGNPFRPVEFDPEWRTSTVVSLAQQMYDEREFGPMPILADALQDAGCADENILSHCRGPGPHVRGCWVVDLILGKE
jgi:hypothetical protein